LLLGSDQFPLRLLEVVLDELGVGNSDLLVLLDRLVCLPHFVLCNHRFFPSSN